MTIQAAIRTLLVQDPAVSALVGERVYPQVAPQGGDMPAVVYTVSGEPLQHQRGMQGLERYEIGLDCWSRARPGMAPYDEARTLARAVVEALAARLGVVGDVRISSVLFGGIYDDGADEETGIYSVGVDVSVWAQPA